MGFKKSKKITEALDIGLDRKKAIEISPLIHSAIKILRSQFGGTKVELLSNKMYRTAPDEYAKIGYLGVDIEIEGIKTFLGCESMAEEICIWGEDIAKQFIYNVITTAQNKRDEKEQNKD